MSNFLVVALVCGLIGCIQSAPQLDQQFQEPHPTQQQSKYTVAHGRFHQDPNLEYNFEWVFLNITLSFSSANLINFTLIIRQKFVNGEEFKENGAFKTVSGMDVIVTKGSYTIVEKDGSITVVNYTADEHGFHPEVGKLFPLTTQ